MIVRIAGKIYHLRHILGDGGGGIVFAHPRDRKLAIKIFNDPFALVARLLALLELTPPDPLFVGSHPTIAWPLEPVFDPQTRQVIGYVMLRVHEAVCLADVVNPANRIDAIGSNPAWLIRAAKSFAMRLYAFHLLKIVRGDVQLRNELISRHGSTTAIDVDSVQFTSLTGELFKCEVGIRDFLAPEILSNKTRERSPATDSWSCGVVVHMLVRGGEHPYNSANLIPDLSSRIIQGIWPDSGRFPKYPPPGQAPRFDTLPSPLQCLFRQTFDAGHGDPTARPSITEWAQTLARMDGGELWA